MKFLSFLCTKWMGTCEAMTSSTRSFAYSYQLVKKCFLKICETSKCHNFLIFQPIFIRFSLFYSQIVILSYEIKLNLLRISPLMNFCNFAFLIILECKIELCYGKCTAYHYISVAPLICHVTVWYSLLNNTTNHTSFYWDWEKSMNMRASEPRKFSHFHILKLLFPSIFCWYLWYFVSEKYIFRSQICIIINAVSFYYLWYGTVYKRQYTDN